MPNGSTGGPVQPIDGNKLRRLFGQSNIIPGNDANSVRVCLECATLGHICRRCRAERYHARTKGFQGSRRYRLGKWWRSTTLYAMNRDYPIALPLVAGAATAWGNAMALAVAYLVDHL